MTRRILSLAAAAAVAWVALPLAQEPAGLTANSLKGLEFRSIGPTLTTGRIQDIEIDPRNLSVWYIASAFGGLWKTENRGITFSADLRQRRRLYPLLRRRGSPRQQYRMAGDR